MRILVKSARGSDDPTKAAFPFLHANALAKRAKNASFANPSILVKLVEWADKILTE